MGKVKWILGNDYFSDDNNNIEDNCILYNLIKNFKVCFFDCFYTLEILKWDKNIKILSK